MDCCPPPSEGGPRLPQLDERGGPERWHALAGLMQQNIRFKPADEAAADGGGCPRTFGGASLALRMPLASGAWTLPTFARIDWHLDLPADRGAPGATPQEGALGASGNGGDANKEEEEEEVAILQALEREVYALLRAPDGTSDARGIERALAGRCARAAAKRNTGPPLALCLEPFAQLATADEDPAALEATRRRLARALPAGALWAVDDDVGLGHAMVPPEARQWPAAHWVDAEALPALLAALPQEAVGALGPCAEPAALVHQVMRGWLRHLRTNLGTLEHIAACLSSIRANRAQWPEARCPDETYAQMLDLCRLFARAACNFAFQALAAAGDAEAGAAVPIAPLTQ